LITPLASGTSSLSSNKEPASYRSLALWLFATFQFFYLLTSTGRVRTPDEYNTLYTTESLVLHHTTAVPQAVSLHNFYGRLDVHGQPRAAYPPGQALAVTPWYAFGQYVLARLPGVPHDPPNNDDTDLIVAFASCLSSATFAALTVTFFFLLLTGIGISERPALMATAILGLATPIFAYSAWLFSEPLSAAIFTGVALLLFVPGKPEGLLKEERSEIRNTGLPHLNAEISPVLPRAPRGSRFSAIALAGLILGLSTLVRPTNVLAIAVFAIAILVRDGKSALKPAIAFCLASAIGIGLLLAHNALLFGSPLAFGYPTVAEGAKRLNSFNTPILTGLYGFLLSPGKSIFLFAPPIVLALLGLKALWRRDRGLATLAVLFPLTTLLVFAKYSQWEGGYCVGPRYLIPALVFLCLGLGPVLAEGQGLTRLLAAALFVLGLLVQLISIATSFMEDQAPRGHYYDANWTYRLNYSLSGQVHLFFKYLSSPEPARLGLGWDRWFVFLAKGGISRATLAVIFAAMALGFAISLLGLAKAIAAQDELSR
jgi:hypothetical protein